jgi:type IX secretion system PorP/SprF family membrane protein
MNPGLTGQMREDFRVGGIYRSQWKDIASPFKTMSFFADMNIKLEKKPVDMISFGANFTDDQLGDGIFKNQYFLVSSAVQKYLGYSRRHMVSFGLQLGYTNQNLNKNGLYFDDQFDDEFLPTLGTGENFGATRNGYMNLNAGLGWDFFANEKLTLNGGLGFHNLTRPKNSLLDGVGETVANKQSVRTVLNVGAVYQLSDKVSLLPSFLYARQAKASDLNLGTNIGFHLNGYKSRNRTTLYVGGFYRVGDAAIAKVGMRFRGVQAMFSYDATMSGMKDINKAPSIKDKTVGAYELSLVYSGFLNRAIPGRLTVPSRFF